MITYYIEEINEVAVRIDSDIKEFKIKGENTPPEKAKIVPLEHPFMEAAIMHGKVCTEQEYNEY